MTRLTPILANETTAAALLDMRPFEFRALVKAGHLPRGRAVGGFIRWDVDDLRKIIRGEAIEGMGGVQW